jgi:hypothetical protein
LSNCETVYNTALKSNDVQYSNTPAIISKGTIYFIAEGAENILKVVV